MIVGEKQPQQLPNATQKVEKNYVMSNFKCCAMCLLPFMKGNETKRPCLCNVTILEKKKLVQRIKAAS